jgi:drug/metabolite transporter (DMT)-like permease
VSLRQFYAVGFLLLVLFDTAGQTGFKLAANDAGAARLDWLWLATLFRGPWVYVAVGAYIGAFFVWMTLLEHAPIGAAFAASHLEIVTVLALSVLLFGESLSASQIVGGCLVLAGIAVLATGERGAEAREAARVEPVPR